MSASEDKLAELKLVRDMAADLKVQAEVIRDEILSEGIDHPYFLDSAGIKRRAYITEPEMLVLDEDAIIAELPPGSLDAAAPRKLDRKGLEQEIKAGRVDEGILLRHGRFMPGTRTVRFDDA